MEQYFKRINDKVMARVSFGCLSPKDRVLSILSEAEGRIQGSRRADRKNHVLMPSTPYLCSHKLANQSITVGQGSAFSPLT